MWQYLTVFYFFFFNDTATTEIYTLSLHDAFRSHVSFFIPYERHLRVEDLEEESRLGFRERLDFRLPRRREHQLVAFVANRSEEHTSELQSPDHLVCRLLLEKKNYRAHRTLVCRS